MDKRFLGWALGGVLAVAGGQTAIACAFHGYTPNPTLVDVLLDTEQAVIARPAPSNTRLYVPVETLMGEPVSEISASASSVMRRRLRGNPDATLLLARDGSYGPWVAVAVLEGGYRDLITQVVQRQSPWLLGADQERLAFFAARVNDPNPDIRRLALRELDRASYGDLQSLRLPVVQNLRRDLKTGEEDLKPIRILLAGLSGDTDMSRYLYAQLDQALDRNTPYLGAYITALVELEGQAAVQQMVARYLTGQTLSATNTEKMLQALAIQYKTAPRPTRRLIAREIAELSRGSDVFAAAAARHFGSQPAWKAGRPAQGGRTIAKQDGGGSDR